MFLYSLEFILYKLFPSNLRISYQTTSQIIYNILISTSNHGKSTCCHHVHPSSHILASWLNPHRSLRQNSPNRKICFHISNVKLNVGINVSYNSYQVDLSKLWSSGRYFVGLGNDFLTFPTINQIIIFSSTLSPLSGTIAGIDYTEDAAFYPSIIARSK